MIRRRMRGAVSSKASNTNERRRGCGRWERRVEEIEREFGLTVEDMLHLQRVVVSVEDVEMDLRSRELGEGGVLDRQRRSEQRRDEK